MWFKRNFLSDHSYPIQFKGSKPFTLRTVKHADITFTGMTGSSAERMNKWSVPYPFMRSYYYRNYGKWSFPSFVALKTEHFLSRPFDI